MKCLGFLTRITTVLLISRCKSRDFTKIRNIFIGQEFMIATDMTTGGSLEERLRWAFKMFDKDGSGKVLIITKWWALVRALVRENWEARNGGDYFNIIWAERLQCGNIIGKTCQSYFYINNPEEVKTYGAAIILQTWCSPYWQGGGGGIHLGLPFRPLPRVAG